MIILSDKDILFMLEILTLPEDIKNILKGINPEKKKIISDELAEILRDICIEYIDIYGHNEAYELTKEGKFINSLIDKLYIE